MSRPRLPIVLGLTLAAGAPGADASGADGVAELVLENALVHTVDERTPRAEAVAIGGGVVLAVGTAREIARWKGPATRVVDLRGRTVVPGFHDAHAHLLGIGFSRLDLDLRGAASYAEVVSRVAEAVRDRRPGEWIRGRGWHEEKWEREAPGSVRGFPTHEALSAVSPDNPVVLERADGHAVLANARAMALRGIDRETRSPDGGEIVRDAAGEPTGVFVDNAETLVGPAARTDDERRRAIRLATEECLREGVTTLTDAGAPGDVLDLYRSMAGAGELRVRIDAMAAGLETLRELGPPEIGRGGGFLTIRAVKVYADGALGSRGAALLEPYEDDAGNVGLVVTPREEILRTARLALEKGYQVATHAIGDRANRLVLDVYEEALAERPDVRDARFRIEHAQVLDEADIPRFSALGVIASMQGIHCPSDRPWAPRRIGQARVREGAYAWRKLLESGARIVNGTDAPVEDLSPIGNFHATVTRQDAGGQPPGGFDPDQKLTRAEALRSMTLEPAWGIFEEDRRGSIAPGKAADLVVLSRDILTVPDDEIRGTEVLCTIVDGRVRYEEPNAKGACGDLAP